MRLRLLFFVALISTGVWLFTGCLHATRTPRAPAEGEPALVVVSWNVNFGLGGSEAAMEALEDATADADLVMLQETNAAWQAAAARRLARRFPHQRWLDDAAAGGQAVLSRTPFALGPPIPAPTGWFPALRVEAQTALGVVQVLGVHLHPPVSEDGSWVRGYLSTSPVRRAELEAFVGELAPALPTLVVGDFNESTSGEAVKFLERRGLRSVLPEYAPRANTWHWPLGRLELRGQLDHLFYDPRALAPLDARVLPIGRSDHWPVRAIFTRGREVPLPAPVRGTSLSLGSAG